MEKPESEPAPAPPEGTLLSEMSGSEMRRLTAVSPEAHLMRLADDPLLLRALLLRQQAAPQPPAAPVGGQISIALARRTRLGGNLTGSAAGRNCYELGHGLREPSLAPTPFAPSRQDREEAVELGARAGGAEPRSGPAIGLFLLAAVLLLWLLVLALI